MRKVERFLLAVAVLTLGWCAWTLIQSRRYQSLHQRDFRQNAVRKTLPAVSPELPPEAAPAEGTAVGRIEIPRIGVSAVIAEGEGNDTLRLAVGHIPGTSLPGGDGNVGLAGHRDSFFRSLSRIRVNDEIRLTAEGGVSSLYRVDSIAVVEPADVSVLQRGPQPSVTLVTCYPFHFLGGAPKRFVVRAGRIPSGFPHPSDHSHVSF